jgi:hypothetical protein
MLSNVAPLHRKSKETHAQKALILWYSSETIGLAVSE